jgi:hypothetical protein
MFSSVACLIAKIKQIGKANFRIFDLEKILFEKMRSVQKKDRQISQKKKDRLCEAEF